MSMKKYTLPNRNEFAEQIIGDNLFPNIFEFGIIVEDSQNFALPDGSNVIMYCCVYKDTMGANKRTWLPRCLVEALFIKEG